MLQDRKKVFYVHPLIERLGELVYRIYQIRNIYDERKYEVNLITYPPQIVPNTNLFVYDIITRGIRVIHTTNHSLIGSAWNRNLKVEEANDCIYAIIPIDKVNVLYIETMKDKPPLFHYRLSPEDLEQGAHLREQFGIPPKARIVTLHVRQKGYFGKKEGGDYYRNASIEHYLPAIEYLIQRGFYVVRLGDPSMTRIPLDHPQLVDAPFHPANNGFVEAYFAAISEFFIGCGSGPDTLAVGFGVPIVFVNWLIRSGIWGNAKDLYAPQKYFSTKLGRYLTFEEMALSPAFDFCRDWLFEQSGIRLDELSPEEILRIVVEMDERLSGTYPSAAQIPVVQRKFRSSQKKAHYFRQQHVTHDIFPYEPFLGMYWSNLNLSVEYLKSNPWFLGHDWPEVLEWGIDPKLAVS